MFKMLQNAPPICRRHTHRPAHTHAHRQWPSGRPVVQLVMFPCSGDEHLLLRRIALSSFNKITFTIFPAHIIYLFFSPCLICAIRTLVQSVKWDRVQGEKRGCSVIPVRRNLLCFNEVQSANTPPLCSRRRWSPACDTEEPHNGRTAPLVDRPTVVDAFETL